MISINTNLHFRANLAVLGDVAQKIIVRERQHIHKFAIVQCLLRVCACWIDINMHQMHICVAKPGVAEQNRRDTRDDAYIFECR